MCFSANIILVTVLQASGTWPDLSPRLFYVFHILVNIDEHSEIFAVSFGIVARPDHGQNLCAALRFFVHHFTPNATSIRDKNLTDIQTC